MRRFLVGLSLALLVFSAASATPSLAEEPCQPVIAPVDPQASAATVCLAATLDAWRAAGVMAVGQQLDLPRRTSPDSPLLGLEPLKPRVIGFDLEELITAEEFYGDDPVPYLIELARSGAVLTATWHPPNPITGGDFHDRSWHRIGQLLDPQSSASAAFWPRYDRALEQLRRLDEAAVPVILKPVHEPGGDWFWWGTTSPRLYRALFAQFQRRAAAAGVHNILWAYAAAPQNRPGIADPVRLLPKAIDIAGLDVYDDERADPVDRLPLADFRHLARVVPRMALTEVGPRLSTDGRWDPRVITDTLRRHGLYASFAMLWRDGPNPKHVYQIASLDGGRAWLAGCPNGLCRLPAPDR